jgi:aryl-alcohol dehydrogenase-like predicted oxidoreductase
VRTIQVPGTTLAPACLCFGTAEFGSTINRDAAFALMNAYVAGGGNFIDTAKVYGDWVPGQVSPSEKFIGEWLQARGNRAEIVLATKGGHYHLDAPQIKRLAPADIVSDLDASLHHLRTDVIDLYWLHRDDPARPVAEMIETLEAQVRAGKIRYYGASNWRLDRLREAQAFARANGAQGFCAVSNSWSLAHVNVSALPDPTMAVMDRDFWECHREQGLAAVPYTSQAYGVFHKLSAGKAGAIPEMYRKMFVNPETEARLGRVRSLSRETGLTITQIVLGYLRSQPFPTIPVFSARNAAQLADTLAAADVSLSPDQVAYLAGGEQIR